jgi:hypothetical protein
MNPKFLKKDKWTVEIQIKAVFLHVMTAWGQ